MLTCVCFMKLKLIITQLKIKEEWILVEIGKEGSDIV